MVPKRREFNILTPRALYLFSFSYIFFHNLIPAELTVQQLLVF